MGLNEQIHAPNLIENKTERINLSTSNTVPHIMLSAEGLENPIHMMIDTGAALNLIKQKAVKADIEINEPQCLKLKGFLTTFNIIPNEVLRWISLD